MSNAMEDCLIYLVDDDDDFREAATELLEICGYRVAAYGSAHAFLAVTHESPACLILDLHMPELSGLEVQARLGKLGRRMPVIFLSGAGSIPVTVKAMRQGAEDFLTKPVSIDVLRAAIERAMAGEFSRREAMQLHAMDEKRFAMLTPREREVCLLLAQGRLNKQVAYELGTTERTIKAHRQRLMQKLEVRSVVELVSRYGSLIGPMVAD